MLTESCSTNPLHLQRNVPPPEYQCSQRAVVPTLYIYISLSSSLCCFLFSVPLSLSREKKALKTFSPRLIYSEAERPGKPKSTFKISINPEMDTYWPLNFCTREKGRIYLRGRLRGGCQINYHAFPVRSVCGTWLGSKVHTCSMSDPGGHLTTSAASLHRTLPGWISGAGSDYRKMAAHFRKWNCVNMCSQTCVSTWGTFCGILCGRTWVKCRLRHRKINSFTLQWKQ
jgi:hypothetical protein